MLRCHFSDFGAIKDASACQSRTVQRNYVARIGHFCQPLRFACTRLVANHRQFVALAGQKDTA